MSMHEFRQRAARIDQQMRRLAAEGVSETPAIIHRMMGYMPDLHRIWVSTSDEQLMALSRELPGFYRYALIMEEASEAERQKASRPYDGMAVFSEHHQQVGSQLLTTATALERDYQALQGMGALDAFRSQRDALDRRHRQWLADVESFKRSLRAQGVAPQALASVNEAFGHLAERIRQLAGGS